MEEMMFLRMMSSGWFSSGIDLSALIAFLVVGVVYLLIPVLGYQTERPAGFMWALYLFILYAAVTLVQQLVQWVEMLGGNGGGMFSRDVMVHFMMLFVLLKSIVFIAAMLAFVAGLRGLRIYHLPPDA
jgi:hypothetical protein